MSSGRVKETSNFIEFANLTVEVAEESYDKETSKIVREAWDQVGVKEKDDKGKDDKGDDGGDDKDDKGCNPM
jgi:hypothetical protein